MKKNLLKLSFLMLGMYCGNVLNARDCNLTSYAATSGQGARAVSDGDESTFYECEQGNYFTFEFGEAVDIDGYTIISNVDGSLFEESSYIQNLTTGEKQYLNHTLNAPFRGGESAKAIRIYIQDEGGLEYMRIYEIKLCGTIGSNYNKWYFEDGKIYTPSSNIGLGTIAPLARLDLGNSGGDIRLYDGNGTAHILGDEASGETDGITLRALSNPRFEQPIFTVESSDYSQRLRVEHNGALKTSNYLEVDGTGNSYIMGNLGLGTTGPDCKLDVNGKIRAEQMQITADVPSSDFVFEKDYNLKSLCEIEQYINKNKHLPEVPSAKEFKENGYKVGEMDDILLRKIEELTLYIIEQQKLIEEQAKEIKDIKAKLK